MKLSKEEIEFLEEHYRRIEAGEELEMNLLEPCVMGSSKHTAQLIKIYLEQKEKGEKKSDDVPESD